MLLAPKVMKLPVYLQRQLRDESALQSVRVILHNQLDSKACGNCALVKEHVPLVNDMRNSTGSLAAAAETERTRLGMAGLL